MSVAVAVSMSVSMSMSVAVAVSMSVSMSGSILGLWLWLWLCLCLDVAVFYVVYNCIVVIRHMMCVCVWLDVKLAFSEFGFAICEVEIYMHRITLVSHQIITPHSLFHGCVHGIWCYSRYLACVMCDVCCMLCGIP